MDKEWLESNSQNLPNDEGHFAVIQSLEKIICELD